MWRSDGADAPRCGDRWWSGFPGISVAVRRSKDDRRGRTRRRRPRAQALGRTGFCDETEKRCPRGEPAEVLVPLRRVPAAPQCSISASQTCVTSGVISDPVRGGQALIICFWGPRADPGAGLAGSSAGPCAGRLPRRSRRTPEPNHFTAKLALRPAQGPEHTRGAKTANRARTCRSDPGPGLEIVRPAQTG